MAPRPVLLLPSLLLALACGEPRGNPPPIAGETDHDESSSSAALEESSTGDDAPQDDGPCREVDLLFVVDNSHSMADEQANLVASFPGFIAGIEELLGPATDYHVGVITTDTNEHNGIGCRRLGALTNRTGGESSSDAMCGPYADGGNFMTVRDELATAFACAAEVGVEGNGFEVPMDALAATLGAGDQGMASCNEGFLREGALLVVTLITDEEDAGDSQGDPSRWYDAVTAGRDPASIVMLALVGHPKPNACIPAQWDGMDGAELAPRLIELTEMFEHGSVGDVCAPDYAPFFTKAVAGIGDACHVTLVPD